MFAIACTAGDDLATTAGSITGGSAEEHGVLAFLNGPDATFDLLDYDIGLDRRAATSIAGFTRGADGVYGTADDGRLATIEALDELYWVGGRAIERILSYVESIGGVPQVRVEGVYFTDAEAAAALALANGATEVVLDDDVKLDARAATGIVAGRPFTDVADIGRVAYVGPSALRRLRDFGGDWTPDTAPLADRVAAILDGHGVPNLRADFPEDVVDEQSASFGDAVSFDDALDAAINSFLTDDDDAESPIEMARNIGPWGPCQQTDPLELVLCHLGLGTAVIGITRHEGDPDEEDLWLPEHGERPNADIWAFYMLIPSMGDVMHWAIVDRNLDADGNVVVYNYGFN
jgi:hypothetical protein